MLSDSKQIKKELSEILKKVESRLAQANQLTQRLLEVIKERDQKHVEYVERLKTQYLEMAQKSLQLIDNSSNEVLLLKKQVMPMEQIVAGHFYCAKFKAESPCGVFVTCFSKNRNTTFDALVSPSSLPIDIDVELFKASELYVKVETVRFNQEKLKCECRVKFIGFIPNEEDLRLFDSNHLVGEVLTINKSFVEVRLDNFFIGSFHISELKKIVGEYIGSLHDYLFEGQKVLVQVFSLNPKVRRLELSLVEVEVLNKIA